MKTFFLTIAILLLSFSSFAKEDLILKFQHQKDKDAVAALILSHKEQLKAQGEKFILISHELMNPNSKSSLVKELLRLKKVNIIIDVVEDRKYYPKSQLENESIACTAPSVDEILNQEIEKVEKVASILNQSCSLSVKCKDSSVSWATMAMGADFAEEIVDDEILKSKESNVKSKTAVIDSGFDKINQTSGLSTPIDVQKANESIVELDHDDNGHGTAVASMISGKHTGVTKNVDLTLMKLVNGRKEGSSKAEVAEAVEKACKQNNDIINVSLGSYKDSKEQVNSKQELWYEVAKKQGCLIIQAAGNDGIRKKIGNLSHDLEDPHLTVEALDQFQEFARFSTVGMVSAPGEKVFSLLSADHKYSGGTSKNMCLIDQNQHGKISGTSFSAPAVAGVASQVVTILKARGVIPKDPVLKIKLIKSILYAAQGYPEKRNGINAYAATLIARKVSKSQQDSSIEELKKIVKEESSQLCNGTAERCEDQLQCSDKKTCVQNLRKKSFLCPFSGEQLEALIVGLDHLKEKEMVMGLLSQIPEKEFTQNQKYKEIYSTDFFDSMLNNAMTNDEIQYLLKKPIFKKNLKWKTWVETFLNESPKAKDKVAAKISLLTDKSVSLLPQWKEWVTINVPKAPFSMELIDLIENPEVQKLVNLNEIAKNILELEDVESKIYFLASNVAQKDPHWNSWVESFLASTKESDHVFALLTDQSILQNKNWYELMMKLWSSNQLNDHNKGRLLLNQDVQKKEEWQKLLDIFFEMKGEYLGHSFILRDENIKKIPKWETYVEKIITDNPDDLLLTDSKVKKLHKWNTWIENFIQDPKNDSLVLLRDQDVQKNENYPKWVELKLNAIKNSFSLMTLLEDEKIQSHPSWEKKVKEIFDNPKESFTQMYLLKNESIQKTGLWKDFLKKYIEDDKKDYKEAILQIPKVLEDPEWGGWAKEFFEDPKNSSFAMAIILKNEDVHKKTEWKNLADTYLQKKEIERHQRDFLIDPPVMKKTEWTELSMVFINNAKDESEMVSFLKEPSVMRKEEWVKLSMAFINNAEDEKRIVDFLRDEYVIDSKNWKKLADAYLKKSKEVRYRQLFLTSEEVAEKLKEQ